MKLPARLLGLLLATLAATALAEDKPVAPAPAVEAKKPDTPAVTPPAEPAKAEAPAAVASTPAAVAPAAEPAPFNPTVHPVPEEKPADPDVLVLPKMTVKQKPRPRLTPEIMVTRKAYGEDLAKQKFTEMERILNGFTLPFFGTSLAERALEDHEREKKEELNQDVSNITKALGTVDAAEAKSLKDAAARP